MEEINALQQLQADLTSGGHVWLWFLSVFNVLMFLTIITAMNRARIFLGQMRLAELRMKDAQLSAASLAEDARRVSMVARNTSKPTATPPMVKTRKAYPTVLAR